MSTEQGHLAHQGDGKLAEAKKEVVQSGMIKGNLFVLQKKKRRAPDP